MSNTWVDNLADEQRDQVAEVFATLPENDSLRRYAGDDVDFGIWLLVVDGACRRRLTVGIFDLPDRLWRDWYDDDMTPVQALRTLLEEGVDA
ncbi:hypothetical protein [Saccharothrix sp. HUAS TT1]|uniref:hypothetical protein n=1 Tax=unclassified Saccharothrix TaxID=2593673 RepID=UPI00345B8EA9